MHRIVFPWCAAVCTAVVIASLLIQGLEAFARPGGGRGPGGPGGDRPGAGGGMRPGPGGIGPGGGPGGVGPGAVGPGAAGPGGVGPGPAVGGRPASPRDVETFLNAKPAAAAAAARTTATPAAAESRVASLQASLAGRTQPFTAAWYAEHPNAWRYAHPYADWWAVAGVAGISSWLGYAAATDAATTAAAPAAAPQAGTAAAPPPADLEWLPLGVFATAPKAAAQAHIYQQLAVSRTGELKGNYYDAISNATQPISGKIDAQTRKATWTVGSSGGATFETTLDALVTTPSGVTMKSGKAVQEWELVQMDKPQAKTPAP